MRALAYRGGVGPPGALGAPGLACTGGCVGMVWEAGRAGLRSTGAGTTTTAGLAREGVMSGCGFGGIFAPSSFAVLQPPPNASMSVTLAVSRSTNTVSADCSLLRRVV